MLDLSRCAQCFAQIVLEQVFRVRVIAAETRSQKGFKFASSGVKRSEVGRRVQSAAKLGVSRADAMPRRASSRVCADCDERQRVTVVLS